MKSKRFEVLAARPVNQDCFVQECPEMGFIAMDSPYDPAPSLKIEGGRVTEMDGKRREDFDFNDSFIADHAIDLAVAEEAMKIDSLEFARRLVDISRGKEEITRLAGGMTPAKLCQVMGHLNVVEMMMAMQKLRERSFPANQTHVTNKDDNPVQIACDAAEAALRGFAETETTVGVARYAPLCAVGLLIGSQCGRPGVLSQCAVEEATELMLGMLGITTYAETLSVYGTEKVFTDGDDTPYSKAFLAAAYASRGMKVRCTSGTASEALMGNAEQKSMLYLEARCLLVIKGAGVQGTQNGSVSCIGLCSSVPSGIRAVLAENLIAAMLGLECASSNDQSFSHSDIRRTARMLMQMLPGTDFIFSGYSCTPNYDNMFAGSNFEADDFDDYNVIQRDLKVDGGLRPVTEEQAVSVRMKAARAMQALFDRLGFEPVTEEQVEQCVYAHGSNDITAKRKIDEDLRSAKRIQEGEINGLDLVKALAARGHEDVARSILEMLKQRISGDYLQTAAILDRDFHVHSSVNDKNTYRGPGTGYRLKGEAWEKVKAIPQAFDPKTYQGG
ncbi:MAG: propanediol/glycerol family dehydratase large subunit [Oscillospiraceae bacterium]|nr:propanediol/glycerol family dehydratase large subunit [Oscillospiraceae bacterium]MCI9363392.1 propanediol/glycerol family dehydratase large subunit [Oscillospiraceae bacterium]RKJ56069.1 propanediol/glycerol family dehydratase large subunit [bacterium 1XD42-8]RKJ65785.1 propanediol/glycerol family dehydratase large subunit [bacterium 1XD42-1]